MKTSIVILTYNQLSYTKLCIESIRTFTDPKTYELIVVDNASNDGTQEWLRQQKDIKTLYNECNVGFPKGCNQGIEVASGENILLLNNDVVVTSNWLVQLVKALYSAESVGAVSCVTNNCSNGQQISINYNNMQEMQNFSKDYNFPDPNKWEERLKLVGFCMLIKRQVIREVGNLDDRFSPGNFEDDDLSLRIRLAGYKLLVCTDTFIHHFGGASFKKDPKYAQLLRKNQKKFTKKWGFDPAYSQNVRIEIIDLIQESPTTDLNVLEVGCACGGTLLGIKNRYKNSHLYGIELNESSGKVASIIADVQDINIETDELTYPESFFDFIIFADVLEHMYNPWQALQNMKKHLKSTGKILISLPNIMHYSVLRPLVNGFWTYEDAGILDRTHMRFFTLSEIYKMLLSTGYQLDDFAGTVLSGEPADKLFIERLALVEGNQKVKEQFGIYQYILQASKSKLYDTLHAIQTIKEPNQDDRQMIIKELDEYTTEKIIKLVSMMFEDEEQVELLNMLGVIYFEAGYYDNVIPYLERAHNTDLYNKEAVFNLAYFLNFFSHHEEAEVFEEKLRQLDKESYLALKEAVASL